MMMRGPKAIRSFVDAEIRPSSIDDDAKGRLPSLELNKKLGAAGILAAVVAAAPQAAALGFDRLPGGVTPAEFDDFHELIISEEFKRIGCYGLADGLVGGYSIGLPPLLKFGSQELQSRRAQANAHRSSPPGSAHRCCRCQGAFCIFCLFTSGGKVDSYGAV